MRVIFTRSKSPLSKSIRSLTNEPVSHCALDFGLFIVHSNLLGLHLSWGSKFRAECEIVHSLSRVVEKSEEDLENVDRLLGKHELCLYDFGALLFLAGSYLARHYLKIPLPKTNLWQSTGMFLCTEWTSLSVNSKENSMITPYQLYIKLKSSGEWRDTDGNQQD